MGVRLTVSMKGGPGGEQPPRTVTLDDEVITLGRDQSCQVQLAQMAVSRTHARITRDGPLCFLEDLGSSYGTQINGQKLPRGEKRLLRNGDVIAVAQFDVVFDQRAEPQEHVAGKTMFVSRGLVKDVMKGISAGESAYFRVMNGPREGEKIEVGDAQEYVFGRDAADADIVLEDDLVSRRHAKVRRDLLGTHLEDLKSRNGIKVNRKRTARATLKSRDEVEIGGVRLLFLDPADAEDPVVYAGGQDGGEEDTASVSARAVPEPEPEPEPEPTPPRARPPAAAPEAPEAPASRAEAPGEADADQAQEEEEQEEEEEEEEAPAPDDEEPPAADESTVTGSALSRVDFKNPQTLVALGLGGLVLLVGVVILVLLLAGA